MDKEAEEKAPVKKSVWDIPSKNAQKLNQNGKDSKPSTPRLKGQESFKKRERKPPKTLKGPGSVEDIKAKMQASTENTHWTILGGTGKLNPKMGIEEKDK